MAKYIIKTKIIKDNLKSFNKEINSYNKRLKTAEKKGSINNKTYKMLMIDKDKKDFYRQNIFTKKQFKTFINTLKKANKNTLKAGRNVKKLGSIINDLARTKYEKQILKQQLNKVNLLKAGRNVKKLGSIINDLAQTKYEKQILKQQLNKVNLLKETFGVSYKDILMNVATIENKQNRNLAYDKLFNRFLKIDYDIPNKVRRFKEILEKEYKERFGVLPNLKGVSMSKIHRLSKLKKFDLRNLSDPLIDTSLVKAEFDEMIDDSRKNKFEDIEDIDEGWEVYE